MEKRLTVLFAALKKADTYDRATIVLHGDHGARIGLTDPASATVSSLTPADYTDAFSTLFAVKAPDITPGVDPRMLPLTSLVPYALDRDEDLLRAAGDPTVYIVDGNGNASPHALPAFPSLPKQLN